MIAVSRYDFQGFFAPIDMSTVAEVVQNTAKAGQTLPVKWRLISSGLPVSDPVSFAGLFSYQVDCTSQIGSTVDEIEEDSTGEAGLFYSGEGYWQYNWKTPKAYAGTCRVMFVRFNDGSASPVAHVKFK